MIINELTINNFRCYYGESKIKFDQDKRMTLIWGDSGYGKSSLLQFIRWMLYGDPDFGSGNDKPLFNISAYNELTPGQELKVSGQLDFIHGGLKYRLFKETRFRVKINYQDAFPLGTTVNLQMLLGDNWTEYKGDVDNKINSFLPRELSKYFLLDGEKAREIVLDSKELKKAIYSLFDLDAYDRAIKHIGNGSRANSVLGIYQKQMTGSLSKITGNADIAATQKKLESLSSDIEKAEREIEHTQKSSNELQKQQQELYKSLGKLDSKVDYEVIIKKDRSLIDQYQSNIGKLKREAGSLWYKNYPYLFLTDIITENNVMIRRKKQELQATEKRVFENLSKPLLKEILDLNFCVCGRPLDEHARKEIDDIVNIMPPNSYVYLFKQFVSTARKRIDAASVLIEGFDEISAKIVKELNRITEIEHEIDERTEDAKKVKSLKPIIEELEEVESEIEKARILISKNNVLIGDRKSYYKAYKKKLDKLMNNSEIEDQYKEKIAFFKDLQNVLVNEKEELENQIRITLDDCVRTVFKQLTTQTEIDADKVRFINDDFTLRETFLTGGQKAVDQYSYIIGMVKALQDMNAITQDYPIIIDAPFAFTGDDQSQHIFETLPKVSKQTAILTLDLHKIADLLVSEDYDFYVIDNATQERAVIRKGNINDFNF